MLFFAMAVPGVKSDPFLPSESVSLERRCPSVLHIACNWRLSPIGYVHESRLTKLIKPDTNV